jgi:UDP-hydrolysing UDP-N-acetyl-D-glucosamine 2-epimerase
VRTVAVVTVGRSDYGIYLPVLRAIEAAPDLDLHLIVSGTHLSPEFGLTISQIAHDGFEIGDRVEMLLSSDSPEGIGKSIGLGVIGFAQAYAQRRPDLVIVLGDRFEMHAAALAALPFCLPVAHVHGGELSEGAMDDALRHSMTKLSHLHFVSTEEYARRVAQLGEEPWRITVTGAPALDNLRSISLMSPAELLSTFGIAVVPPPLLVTFHPVTLEYDKVASQAAELMRALDEAGLPVLFTQPNADPGGRRVSELIDDYVQAHSNAQRVDNLGTRGYFSVMALAAAMVGNSSSGLIEAPSLGLPVVNVGNRQSGRVKGTNVIDVGDTQAEVLEGIRRATQPGFRETLRGRPNPYGNGLASGLIVERLRKVVLDSTLRIKRFQDLGDSAGS